MGIKRVIGAKKDEYFVNQKHTDKSELNNLLESAGISKCNQHYIVPQGQIAQRVKERDNERLQLIKEIAGTRVYDERRNESLKLMTNADNKRDKVKLVIDYFAERLSELKDEKEELAKYEKLDKQRRSVEFSIYDRERKDTQKSLAKLEQSEGKTDEKNEEFHAKLKKICAKIEESQAEKEKLNKNLDKTQIELKAKRKALQSTSRLIVTLNTKKNELMQDNENYRGKKQKYEQQMAELMEEIDETKGKLAKVMKTFDAMKKKEMEFREKMKENESNLQTLYSKQERLGQYKSKKERNKKLKDELSQQNEELVAQQKFVKKTNDKTLKKIEEKIVKYQNELTQLEKLQKNTEKSLKQNGKNKLKFKQKRSELQNERKKLWKIKNDLSTNGDDLK